MRHYIATLHKRPDHHKRRFALLVAAGVSLFIFAIWSMVTFGEGGIMAQSEKPVRAHEEVSPLTSIKQNVAETIGGVKGSLESLNSNGQ
jgi:hypothetical protein